MNDLFTKNRIALVAGLALVILVGAGIMHTRKKSSSSAAQQSKLAALKELRDSGVITPQEFDSKVQTLQAAAPAEDSAPAQDAPAHDGKTLWPSMRKVEISDPQYQMTAYTLDVPSDWKFAGTIARDPGCHAAGAGLKYTVQSPDGLTAIVQMPGVSWTWTDGEGLKKIMERQGCPSLDISTAADFLTKMAVPNLHPNARVVSVQPLEPQGMAALAEQLQKKREQNEAMARQYGQPPQKLSIDGARVRIQYERDGHQFEEQIGTVIDCLETKSVAMYAMPSYRRRTCSSRVAFITRAPQGHLDELLVQPQYREFAKGIQINHDWDNRVAADLQANYQKFQAQNNAQFQANLQQNQKNFEGQIQRGKQFQQDLRASTDRALAADRARQDAMHESAQATVRYSLDRQVVTNPTNGKAYEVSNQYNHTWVSSDGSTIIQNQDHNYDPNGRVYPVSQSWTELSPK
jgi:hypothetical protein